MNITAGRTASTNYNDDDKCCCCHSFERRQCKKDKDRDEVRFVVSMIPKILFRVSLTLHSLKKRKKKKKMLLGVKWFKKKKKRPKSKDKH